MLGQTESKNNLFEVKNTITWLFLGGFMWFVVVSAWFQLVPAVFRWFHAVLGRSSF